MTDRQLTVGRYDRPTIAKAFYARTANLHLQARDKYIARMKQTFTHPHILDVGCGIGRDVRSFLESGLSAVGVDGAAENLKLAHENLGIPQSLLFQADVTNMPFLENSFNGIWMVAVLGHFEHPDNQQVLNELVRVAKPGALFFSRVRMGNYSGMQERDGTTRFYRHYQPTELKDLMRNAGLENIRFGYAKGEPDHPAKEWIHAWANVG